MPLSGVMGHCCVRTGHDEIGSYTRKNVHRKKKQGQEVSCIQNGMGVGGGPYIAYDPNSIVSWKTGDGSKRKMGLPLPFPAYRLTIF